MTESKRPSEHTPTTTADPVGYCLGGILPTTGRAWCASICSASARPCDPDTWLARTPQQEGSWWTAWARWLAERSSGRVPPRPLGAAEQGYPPLEDAPGTYVFET